MARITKSATKSQPAAAPAKVGKVDKTAKVAKSTTKAAKADVDPDKAPAPRGQYAGRKYTITDEGKAANPRGNRGARWAIVKAARNTADVLGQPYTRADGAEGTITSSGIRNFVNRGFIAFAD